MNVTSAQLAAPLTTLTHHTGPWYRTGEHEPLAVIVWHGSAVSQSRQSRLFANYYTVCHSGCPPLPMHLHLRPSSPYQPATPTLETVVCTMYTQHLGLELFGQCFHDSPK